MNKFFRFKVQGLLFRVVGFRCRVCWFWEERPTEPCPKAHGFGKVIK